MFLNHGGDIYSAGFDGKKTPLDFSANINPFGLPRRVVFAIIKNARNFSAYPDPQCRRLRAALSIKHGIDTRRIVCGAGAADIIYRIASAIKPRRALVTAPTFSEYEKAVREAGGSVDHYNLIYPNFEINDSILPQITKEHDIVFICNPNNPTGKLISNDTLKLIIERCSKTETMLVIDECFNNFVDFPQAHSAERFLNTAQNIIILNAFTKTYALAGLRAGYALCSQEKIANDISCAGQSWPVSGAAECAALAALKCGAYLKKSLALIKSEKLKLKHSLESFNIEVLGAEANYIFFRLNSKSAFCAEDFFDKLLEHNMLIRKCKNYNNLDGSYFRIAVRKPCENRKFILALEDIKNTRRNYDPN